MMAVVTSFIYRMKNEASVKVILLTLSGIFKARSTMAAVTRFLVSFLTRYIPEYNELENEASESYGITSKPGKARSVAQHCSVIPSFITELVRELETIEMLGQNAEPLGI